MSFTLLILGYPLDTPFSLYLRISLGRPLFTLYDRIGNGQHGLWR